MTETFIETPEDPSTDILQILAAILLGIAATLTAFSAYKAALTDGDALQGYTVASQKLTDSNFFYGQGNQIEAGDRALFVEYASAAQQGNTELADYLVSLMRPELSDAVTWWQETDEAVTPFDDIEGNPYVVADYGDGEALAAESKDAYEEAAAADEQGDKFELSTVFLALTLFFGGIATLFSRRPVRIVLLGMGAVTLAVGAVRLATAL